MPLTLLLALVFAVLLFLGGMLAAVLAYKWSDGYALLAILLFILTAVCGSEALEQAKEHDKHRRTLEATGVTAEESPVEL